MTRYLVKRGTKGWMIWDRQRKGPAIAKTIELTEFPNEAQAKLALKFYIASGGLIDTGPDQQEAAN